MTTEPLPAEVADASTTRLRPGFCWWLLAIATLLVAGYALTMQDARSVRDAVPGMPWIDELHFASGGVAMAIGIFCFRRDVLVRRRAWHRRLGQIYISAALCSGLAGLFMALFASGGLPARLGFVGLALAWLLTTTMGWREAHGRRFAAHRRCMVRSYAVCCAALTLRIELPILAWSTGSFALAYQIVSWSSWVLNLLFAEWWLAHTTTAGGWRSTAGRSSAGPNALDGAPSDLR